MKAIRKIFILLLYFLIISCTASNESGEKQVSNKEKGKNEKQETAQKALNNDSIQRSFMGASFGESKNSVIKKIRAQGLHVTMNTQETVQFMPNNYNYSFGGLLWNHLDIYFSNNVFVGIVFYTNYKDKTMAIKKGKEIYHAVSKKYNMITYETDNKTNFLDAGCGCYYFTK